MKVKIKDGGIYRTVEIESSDYGIYLEKGYTKVVEEPIKIEEPIEVKEPKEEPKVIEEPKVKKEITELPKSKRKNKK